MTYDCVQRPCSHNAALYSADASRSATYKYSAFYPRFNITPHSPAFLHKKGCDTHELTFTTLSTTHSNSSTVEPSQTSQWVGSAAPVVLPTSPLATTPSVSTAVTLSAISADTAMLVPTTLQPLQTPPLRRLLNILLRATRRVLSGAMDAS
jgi:hypothetical protein